MSYWRQATRYPSRVLEVCSAMYQRHRNATLYVGGVFAFLVLSIVIIGTAPKTKPEPERWLVQYWRADGIHPGGHWGVDSSYKQPTFASRASCQREISSKNAVWMRCVRMEDAAAE
jgi:hypothetical protein